MKTKLVNFKKERKKAAKEARNDQPNDDGTEWQGPVEEAAERQGATFEAAEERQGAIFEVAEEKQGATFKAEERQSLPREVECHLFMCRHEGCGRCYPTKKGRAQHEKIKHVYCLPESCGRCLYLATKQENDRQAKELQRRLEEAREAKRHQQEELLQEVVETGIKALREIRTTDIEGSDVAVGVALKLIEAILDKTAVMGVEDLVYSSPMIEGWIGRRFARDMRQEPSLKELVIVKNVLQIADHCWPLAVKTFRLSKDSTLHHVKKKQREMLDGKTWITEGGRGSYYPLANFIQEVFATSGLEAMDDPKLKFSFDGATASERGHKQLEVGTIEFLSKKLTLSEMKSSHNCHPWILYLGKEDRKMMIEELGKNKDFINEWAKNGLQLTSKTGEVVQVETCLVVDLKTLVVLTGKNEFYRTNTCYRCFWCNMTKDELESQVNARGEVEFLSEEKTKFHTLEEIINDWQTISHLAPSTRKSQASQHNGQVEEPILLFASKQVIPCLLHLVMAVCRKLLNKTLELVWIDPKGLLVKLLAQRLEKMGIYLVESKKAGNFSQRVKKSRFNRREFLIVLEYAEEWLAELDADVDQSVEETTEQTEEKRKEKEREVAFKDHLQRVRGVWKEFRRVCALAMQEKLRITEQEWKREARQFLLAYLNTWTVGDITTYIHIFVDHLGYWLEKEGSVEKFSNFPIESTHAALKRMVKDSTQGFAGMNTGTCQLTQQLLERRTLETNAAAESPLLAGVLCSRTRGEESWSDRNVKHFPDLERYLQK
ncbi:hypothetical protein QOT17_009620 [Balamuthia mandrillaris]